MTTPFVGFEHPPALSFIYFDGTNTTDLINHVGGVGVRPTSQGAGNPTHLIKQYGQIIISGLNLTYSVNHWIAVNPEATSHTDVFILLPDDNGHPEGYVSL